MNYLLVYLGAVVSDVIPHFLAEVFDHLLRLDGEFIFFTVVNDGALSYAFHVKPELVETSVVAVCQAIDYQVEPHLIWHPTLVIIRDHFFDSQ